MVYAMDSLPNGCIFSRRARAQRATCIDVPFRGWRRTAFDCIGRVPILRRRRDLGTLLSDVQFDFAVARQASGARLFDGVMGQCSQTFDRLGKKNVPLVLTALNTHLDNVDEVLRDEHKRLDVRLPSFINPRMRERVHREIKQASCIRAVSNLVKDSFVRYGMEASKVEVVLPAVDLDYFRPTPKKDDVFRVLAVLTIDPRKGAYYLLKAFEKAAIPNSELVIIGATGDPWAKRMVAEFKARLKNFRLQFADVLREPVENTYGQASVFVHPALEDGFALAVGQALACGKPVITTHQTGAAELVADGENGYVLECRDVDGIVDRLRELARNPDLVDKLSAAAPHAVAHLGYPSLAENVARLYNCLLGKRQ